MGVTTTDRCRVPQAFWRVVESIGIPPSALLRQARLPATLHLGGPAIVTTAQYFALMRALEGLPSETPTAVAEEAGGKIVVFPREWLRDRHSRHLAELPVDVPWDDPALLDAMFALRRDD